MAVPLGLILNEFVTNTLKHAFGEEGGTIAVRLADTGNGLPAEPRPAAPGSGLGIRLVEGLTQEIGAEPRWSSEGGTALSFEFKP